MSIKELCKRSREIETMSVTECVERAAQKAWSRQINAASARDKSPEYAGSDNPDYAPDTRWSIYDRLGLTERERAKMAAMSAVEMLSNKSTFRGVDRRVGSGTSRQATSRPPSRVESPKRADKLREQVFENLGLKV